jgi:hypothetical protein
MPALEADKGMIVGYVLGGNASIECVTKVDETGVWVVCGSKCSGRRRKSDGMRVVFSGSDECREEIGEQWRVLDLDKESEEAHVKAWVEDVRDNDLEVCVVSSIDHCECRTSVRRACGRVIESKLPCDDDSHMRARLEEVDTGCGEFVQCTEEFNALAKDPTVELVGFSDGSLSDDYTNGG